MIRRDTVKPRTLLFKSRNKHRDIVTSFICCKLRLVSLEDVYVLNSTEIILNHAVLWAQPLIETAAEVLLHYYLNLSLLERGSVMKAYSILESRFVPFQL